MSPPHVLRRLGISLAWDRVGACIIMESCLLFSFLFLSLIRVFITFLLQLLLLSYSFQCLVYGRDLDTELRIGWSDGL